MWPFLYNLLWFIFGLVVMALTAFYVIRNQRIGEDANGDAADGVNQAEMEQMVQEVNAVAEHVEGMAISVQKVIRHLRESADYLDQVWKDCKMASACGSTAGIVGGLLTVGGGVATVMTAGAATPLLIMGTALSAAGACTNLGANIIEACTNNHIIQAADGAVNAANQTINEIKEKIRLLKNGKSQLRLAFLAGLASRMLGADHLAVLFIKSLARPDLLAKTLSTAGTRAVSELALRLGATEVTTTATRGLLETGSREAVSVGVNAGARKFGKTGAVVARKVGKRMAARAARKAGSKAGVKVLGKAGSKTASNAGNVAVKNGSGAVGKVANGTKVGAKSAGTLIIGVSAAFLILDAMELTFTVRDIKNEGSDAAKSLRAKADELEAEFCMRD